jgi:hypothetical protein
MQLQIKLMTTIFGLQSNHGLESIVLIADNQSNHLEDGEITKTIPITKLFYGDFWVMGDSGGDDKDVRRFYNYFRGYKNAGSNPVKAKSALKTAVTKGFFPQVDKLNRNVMRKTNDIENTHNFILAVNEPKLELYKVDEFGNFHKPDDDDELDYVSLSDDKEEIDKYITDLLADRKYDRERITTGNAIDIAIGLMKRAERKANSGLGYDLIVISNGGIHNVGRNIRKKVMQAEYNAIEKEKEKFIELDGEGINTDLKTIRSSPDRSN